MFGNDRRQMRRFFTDAWQKQRTGLPMEPMEHVIADIIQQHPEYHHLLEQGELALDKDFLPEIGETNPFLHISMHIGLQEQISIDRPPGITAAYRELIINNGGDVHTAEHIMMDCLAQMIWESQRDNKIPNEHAYLECIKNLIRSN